MAGADLNVSAKGTPGVVTRLVVAGGDDGWRGGSRGFDGVVERTISRPIVLDGRFEFVGIAFIRGFERQIRKHLLYQGLIAKIFHRKEQSYAQSIYFHFVVLLTLYICVLFRVVEA